MEWQKLHFSELKPGDIVRHASGDPKTYIVTENLGTRAIAVRSLDITNEREWHVLRESNSSIAFDPEPQTGLYDDDV